MTRVIIRILCVIEEAEGCFLVLRVVFRVKWCTVGGNKLEGRKSAGCGRVKGQVRSGMAPRGNRRADEINRYGPRWELDRRRKVSSSENSHCQYDKKIRMEKSRKTGKVMRAIFFGSEIWENKRFLWEKSEYICAVRYSAKIRLQKISVCHNILNSFYTVHENYTNR